MTDHQLHRLDLLLLARLATAGTQRLAPSRIESDLYRFVEARLARREWSSQCAARLEALRARGYVDGRRKATEAGLQRLRAALGVRELPPWSKLWKALVPALALDLPGAQWSELASADKLRARLIRQHRGLPVPQTPTLTQVVDAQAWQALGVEDRGKLTLGKVRRALLERSLGTTLRTKSLDAAKAGEWLATEAAETTKRDVEAIQRSLVSRWLFDGEPGEAPAPAVHSEAAPDRGSEPIRPEPARAEPVLAQRTRSEPTPTERTTIEAPRTEPPSLEGWAQQVLAIADATADGRYGDERVFIASVWRAAQAGPAPLHIPLPAFKARLVEANRAGLLRLHRADLVGAMDRALVQESETQHLNATFHFIEVPARSTP